MGGSIEVAKPTGGRRVEVIVFDGALTVHSTAGWPDPLRREHEGSAPEMFQDALYRFARATLPGAEFSVRAGHVGLYDTLVDALLDALELMVVDGPLRERVAEAAAATAVAWFDRTDDADINDELVAARRFIDVQARLLLALASHLDDDGRRLLLEHAVAHGSLPGMASGSEKGNRS